MERVSIKDGLSASINLFPAVSVTPNVEQRERVTGLWVVVSDGPHVAVAHLRPEHAQKLRDALDAFLAETV